MNQTTLERTRITAAGAEISISPRTTQYNKTEKKSINFVDIDKSQNHNHKRGYGAHATGQKKQNCPLHIQKRG